MQPEIIVLPADSAHQGGPWDRLRAIVLHHTAGTDSRDWLTRTSAPPASSHALISKAGVIYRLVELGQQAYHVGYSQLGVYAKGSSAGSCNEICYGIELENLGDGEDPYPDAQIDACGYEIARVWRADRVAPIITHELIDTNGKTDPRGLDLAQVYRRALVWYDELGMDHPTPLPVTPYYTADSPILAAPGVLVATALANLPRPHTSEYTDADVRTIVTAYYDQCAPLQIDPLIPLAQCMHETGALTSWWCARPRRNPAGIGVTGAVAQVPGSTRTWTYDPRGNLWREGLSFAGWVDESIPAHLGRLLAYALTDDQADAAQRAAIQIGLARRSLSSKLRGIAPTLRGLNGRWAVPGTHYADALALWANRLAGHH